MSRYSKGEWALIAFSAAYIAAFALYYISERNFEFLWYVAVMVFFFVLLIATIRPAKFSIPLLWGLSTWGLLHMAGGGLQVGDHVLYAQVLLPLIQNGEMTILKYDQVVHAFGFGVATLLVHQLMGRFIMPERKGFSYFLIIALGGMGLGVVNEIVEFIAVLMVPDNGVGGYFNISLDLVFNTLGASIAAFSIYLYERKYRQKPTPAPAAAAL